MLHCRLNLRDRRFGWQAHCRPKQKVGSQWWPSSQLHHCYQWSGHRQSQVLLGPFQWQLVSLFPQLFPRHDEDALPTRVSCSLFDSEQRYSKNYSVHLRSPHLFDFSVAGCLDQLNESWSLLQFYLLMYLLFTITTEHLLLCGFGSLEYRLSRWDFNYDLSH